MNKKLNQNVVNFKEENHQSKPTPSPRTYFDLSLFLFITNISGRITISNSIECENSAYFYPSESIKNLNQCRWKNRYYSKFLFDKLKTSLDLIKRNIFPGFF